MKGRAGTEHGFTLIELMVVVTLITLLSVLALPSISSYFRVSLSSATRELATTIKETYNSTMITGKVHRLVYDLKGNQYWVEVGPSTALLDTEQTREQAAHRARWAKSSDAPPPSNFALAKEVTRKKVALPRGVAYEDLITEQSKEPLTDGIAYTHFFPHGLTERTIIHLTDSSKNKISLVIPPIIGKTDLYERYVTQDEIFGK